MTKEAGIVYDWSKHEGPEKPVRQEQSYIELLDETFRDGLQGIQVDLHPSEEEKKIYLELTSKYADRVDLGYPGSEDGHKGEIARLLRYVIEKKLDIKPIVTGRGADVSDICPIIDISHELDGYPVGAYVFLDGSTERATLQGWNRREKISQLEQNINLLIKHSIPVAFVAERSSSTNPDELREVLEVAANAGSKTLVITDTQGRANPKAISRLCRWVADTFSSYPDLSLEAHFHNSRGMAIANSIEAAHEGFDRIDVTFAGIGEGAGNADYLITLINLNMEGFRHDYLKDLKKFKKIASEILKYSIPSNTPFYGESAFATGSGIHASAILKEAGHHRQDQIYFCIDPVEIGEEIVVKIGPFSGQSSIIYVLMQEGIKPTEEMVRSIFSEAKSSRGYLSKATILGIAERYIKTY